MARRHYILIDLLYPNTSNCYIYTVHTHYSLLFPLYIPTIIYIYTYLYQYMFISLYIYINIYIYIHTCMHACMHTYRQTDRQMCIYIYIFQISTHTHIYIVVDSPLYPHIINPPNIAQATVETSIAGTKVLRGVISDHGSVFNG